MHPIPLDDSTEDPVLESQALLVNVLKDYNLISQLHSESPDPANTRVPVLPARY